MCILSHLGGNALIGFLNVNKRQTPEKTGGNKK